MTKYKSILKIPNKDVLELIMETQKKRYTCYLWLSMIYIPSVVLAALILNYPNSIIAVLCIIFMFKISMDFSDHLLLRSLSIKFDLYLNGGRNGRKIKR